MVRARNHARIVGAVGDEQEGQDDAGDREAVGYDDDGFEERGLEVVYALVT